MKVRNVMETKVITISEDGTYQEAARLMHKHGFSGLPVLNADGQLTGVISEKDLFRAIYPCYADYCANPEIYSNQEEQEAEIDSINFGLVREYMSTKVLTIDPDAPILKAGGMMLAKHIHRLPVIENGKMVGIVTRKEIFGAILAKGLTLQDCVVVQGSLRETEEPRKQEDSLS